MLSFEELRMLDKLYLINMPDIMPLEIISDLFKDNKSEDLNTKEVVKIASKFSYIHPRINVDHISLIISSLLGDDYMNVYKPVLKSSKIFPVDNGGYGVLIDEHPDNLRMQRWAKGDITEQDIDLAKEWRKMIKNNNISEVLKEVRDKGVMCTKFQSISDVITEMNSFLCISQLQEFLIENLILSLSIQREIQIKIKNNWRNIGKKLLREFAPYAYFNTLLDVTYAFCANSHLCGLKKTDLCDLLYMRYLPFSNIFCSNDKFHKELVPHFLTEKQTFVTGDDLKMDLSNTIDYYKTKPDFNQAHLTDFSMLQPPRLDGSFTYKMWRKYLPNMCNKLDDFLYEIRESQKYQNPSS